MSNSKASAFRDASHYLRQIADAPETAHNIEAGLCYNLRSLLRGSAHMVDVLLEMRDFFAEKGWHPLHPIEIGA